MIVDVLYTFFSETSWKTLLSKFKPTYYYDKIKIPLLFENSLSGHYELVSTVTWQNTRIYLLAQIEIHKINNNDNNCKVVLDGQ